MKAFRSTLLLLVIAAAVGGYIYFNERGPVAGENATVLLRADSAALHQIGVQPPGGAPLTLLKNGDAWNVRREGKDALTVPADADAVKTLLDGVQLVQSETVVPADTAKLAQYGLDKPRSRLTINDTTLEFGTKPSFDQSHVYAKVGNQIALLPATLADAAAKSWNEWRDKTILRLTPDDVTTLDVQAPAVKATFAKTKEESKAAASDSDKDATTTSGTNIWNLTRPVAALGEAGTLDAFINQLSTTKTTEFLDDHPAAPAKWGLDKPLTRIEVSDGKGQYTLLVGKKLPPVKTATASRPGAAAGTQSGGYAAQNSFSPAVFRLSDTTFGLINRPLRDWRAKTVLAVAPATVTQLKVEARGQSRVYNNANGQWSQTSGSGGPQGDALKEGVTDVLLAVQSLRAQDFLDAPAADATYGFDHPVFQLDMSSSAWSGSKTLQLGAKSGKVYARVGDNHRFSPPVFVLPATALGDLNGKLDVLLSTPHGK